MNIILWFYTLWRVYSLLWKRHDRRRELILESTWIVSTYNRTSIILKLILRLILFRTVIIKSIVPSSSISRVSKIELYLTAKVSSRIAKRAVTKWRYKFYPTKKYRLLNWVSIFLTKYFKASNLVRTLTLHITPCEMYTNFRTTSMFSIGFIEFNRT